MTTHEGPKNFELHGRSSVQFGEFRIGQHVIEDIAGVNGSVLAELSKVFDAQSESGGWTVEELGALIGKIGPAKTLQDNIPAISAVLPEADGKQLAIEWVKSTGLLEPVFRNFDNPQEALPGQFETAVITGGVRNWMMRRAKLLVETSEQTAVSEVLLVAGARQMGVSEGSDVTEGDTEATYMARVIRPMLEDAGLSVRMCTPETTNGEEIAAIVAQEVGAGNILVICNAGNWVQNGGQIRRAIGSDSVFVVSDKFPIAENNEPPSVAQNPFTALGIIARNLKELKTHQK